MPKPQHIKSPYQRFWDFSPSGLAEASKKIEDIEQIIVVPLPRSVFTRTAVSFAHLNSENPFSQTYIQIVQILLWSLVTLRGQVSEKKDLTLQGDIASVRLETVFSKNTEYPKIVQYRLWILLHRGVPGLGHGLEEVLKENQRIHNHYDGIDTVHVKNERNMPKVTLLPGAKNWREGLFPHEKFRLIQNKEQWGVRYCDFYMGKNRCALQMEQILSMSSGLGSSGNPANPANIFNVPDLFSYHTPSDVHPEQRNINNYYILNTNTNLYTITFPDLNLGERHQFHVLKLTMHDAVPSIFCYRWLPEYQKNKLQDYFKKILENNVHLQSAWNRYINRGDGTTIKPEDEIYHEPTEEELHRRNELLQSSLIQNQPLEDEQPFDSQKILENNYDPNLELLNNRALVFWYTSDLKQLRQENEDKIRKIKQIKDQKERDEAYEKFEKTAFEEFEGRCWSPDADISEIGHKIRAWGMTSEVRDFTVNHPKFDPSMSVFGNMIAKKIKVYEEYHFVASIHTQLLTGDYGKLDAYRHSNNLHFNMFSSGVGGTSKSFMFEKLELFSIPGTVEQISYETLRANAVDGDHNDTIILMNEIPRDMLSENVSNGALMQSSFKERLTSLKVKVKLITVEEKTGRREQRISESDCIGVWFGATNDDFSKLDEALASRFHMTTFPENKVEGREIVDKMSASENLPPGEKRRLELYVMESRVEQYRYYLVEKLIMTHCLPEVSRHNAAMYFRKLLDSLKKKGTHVHTRTFERMMIMTRILTICHALECTFNIPTGMHYKKRFKISMLRDIKPFLFPTLEIMQFVAGLFSEQLIIPMQNEVMHAVFKFHTTGNKRTGRFRKIFAPPQTQNKGSSIAANRNLLTEDDDQPPGPPLPPTNTSNMTGETGTFTKVARDKVDDYNYVFVGKTIEDAVKTLYSIIDDDRQVNAKPSGNQIKFIIRELNKRVFLSKPYIKVDATADEPVVDAASENLFFQPVKIDHDGVYFHYSLLKKTYEKTDEILPFLQELWYANLRKQKVIHGVRVDKYPQLMQTLIVEPNPNIQWINFNPLHLDEISRLMLYNDDLELAKDAEIRGSVMEIVDEDLDDKSFREHFEHLGLELNNDLFAKYHPRYISARENSWLKRMYGIQTLENGTEKIKNTFNYPEDQQLALEAHENNRKKDFKTILDNKENDKYRTSKRKRHSEEVVTKRLKTLNTNSLVLFDEDTTEPMQIEPQQPPQEQTRIENIVIQPPIELQSLSSQSSVIIADPAPSEDHWSSIAQNARVDTQMPPRVIQGIQNIPKTTQPAPQRDESSFPVDFDFS